MRFTESFGRWSVLARAPPGHADDLLEFLRPLGAPRVTVNARVADTVVEAQLPGLPPAWGRLVALFPGPTFMARTDGHVRILGPPDPLRDALDDLEAQPLPPTPRPSVPERAPRGPSLLTAKQERVLRLALERGYFALPHGTDLRRLADELRMSPASCSEVLRRAEARVLQHYVDGAAPKRPARRGPRTRK